MVLVKPLQRDMVLVKSLRTDMVLVKCLGVDADVRLHNTPFIVSQSTP